MSLQDKVFETSTQTLIALIVVLGGMLFLAFIETSEVIKTTVGNMMLVVIGYYFGSSRSTAKKDETIANIAEAQSK